MRGRCDAAPLRWPHRFPQNRSLMNLYILLSAFVSSILSNSATISPRNSSRFSMLFSPFRYEYMTHLHIYDITLQLLRGVRV